MNNFSVGDEVQFLESSTKFVITSISQDGKLNGIGLDGVAFCGKNQERWQKTGRHFKEAEDLMKALSA
jgi:uncharacterized protein YodC (DUF2158 family)